MTFRTLSLSISSAVLAVLVAALGCNLRDESRTEEKAGGVTGESPSPAATRAAPAEAPPAEDDAGAEDEADADAGDAGEPEPPSWVPDAGRLTIVGARDLERNLGIVADAGPDGMAP